MRAQANPSKNLQREMPLVGNVSAEITLVQSTIVAMCDTEQAAIRLCLNQSKAPITQETAADHLGMTKGAFNTILNSDQNNRPRFLPLFKVNQLQRLCRNKAVTQWMDMEMQGLLNRQRSVVDRKAELLAELERLEAQTEKLNGYGL